MTERIRPVVICGEGRTKQSEKDACDINRIMKTFARTGKLPDHLIKSGVYSDVSQYGDFQEAQNIILRAQSQFDLLPSQLRKRFDNDPAVFLAAFNDPANEAYFREMGLLKEKPKNDEKPAPAGGEGA